MTRRTSESANSRKELEFGVESNNLSLFGFTDNVNEPVEILNIGRVDARQYSLCGLFVGVVVEH